MIRRALCLGLLCATGSAFAAQRVPVTGPDAAGDAGALARAARAYEVGRLADALTEYETLVRSHPADPALSYNLGNTYWRLGQRGKAILWYERARRLAPRDGDTRFNLALARSSLTDEEPGWGEAFDRILTPRELAWVSVLLLWGLCLTAGLALILEWPWAKWGSVVRWGLPLLIVLAGWAGIRAHDLNRRWAVVAVPTAEVRSGPGDQFPVGYTAPEGQRALILNRRPGWIELGIPSKSLKGWVTESAVEAIKPGRTPTHRTALASIRRISSI